MRMYIASHIPYKGIITCMLTEKSKREFLAALVALHFTPVSERVSDS